MIQAELTGSVSNEVVNNEATTEQDALAINLSPENGDIKFSKDIDVGITESDNTLPDNLNIIRLVKKVMHVFIFFSRFLLSCENDYLTIMK